MTPFDDEAAALPDKHQVNEQPRTLAQLIDTIQADRSLSADKRRDWTSSVRCFAKALNLDLATAPAAIAPYRMQLRAFLPLGAGLKTKRWATIRSGYGAAVRRYCPTTQCDDRPKRLSANWEICRGTLIALRDDKLVRGLSAFIHFCKDNQIEPDKVNDKISARFLQFKREATTHSKPEKVHRQTCVLWNEAVDHDPGWPRQKLAIPSYRKRTSLAWDQLPPAFVADLAKWAESAAKRSEGFEDEEEGGARPLADATIATRKEQMRRLASMMLKAGMPSAELQSLRDLCRINWLKAGLTLYAAHLGRKDAPSLCETMAGLIALARHDLNMPSDVLVQLRKIKRQTGTRSRGMTEKNYERLRPLRDQMVCNRLITLPLKLATAAGRLSHPRKRAIAFQTALLLAFLILIPLRLGNIRHLRLDQHFRWSSDRRRRRLFLVIPGSETKNKVRLEIEVPLLLQRLLEAYIEQHRSHFPHADGPSLFPGACDVTRPKTEVMLREQIEKAIARHIGIQFNPHLARHLAAYLWLREHPGDYGTVARMLGHKNPQTTYQFYCGLEQIETALRYNEQILKTWTSKRP